MSLNELLGELDRAGLDPYEYRLIMHIAINGPSFKSHSTLAERCSMSKTQAGRIKKRLLKRGYLRHGTAPNGKPALIATLPNENPDHYSYQPPAQPAQDDIKVIHNSPEPVDKRSCEVQRSSQDRSGRSSQVQRSCEGQRSSQDRHLKKKNNNNNKDRDRILSFLGFTDALRENDIHDPAELLAWAWHVKDLNQQNPDFNHVGNARKQWRSGSLPPYHLLQAARIYMDLDDDQREELAAAAEEYPYNGAMYLTPDHPANGKGQLFYQIYKNAGHTFGLEAARSHQLEEST